MAHLHLTLINPAAEKAIAAQQAHLLQDLDLQLVQPLALVQIHLLEQELDKLEQAMEELQQDLILLQEAELVLQTTQVTLEAALVIQNQITMALVQIHLAQNPGILAIATK